MISLLMKLQLFSSNAIKNLLMHETIRKQGAFHSLALYWLICSLLYIYP